MPGGPADEDDDRRQRSGAADGGRRAGRGDGRSAERVSGPPSGRDRRAGDHRVERPGSAVEMVGLGAHLVGVSRQPVARRGLGRLLLRAPAQRWLGAAHDDGPCRAGSEAGAERRAWPLAVVGRERGDDHRPGREGRRHDGDAHLRRRRLLQGRARQAGRARRRGSGPAGPGPQGGGRGTLDAPS
ncbi:hypothetical protein CC_3700 [Caulobacter vibrioides CB15]|uniref:Uncharacterized protein n=1 Tax=Caulobacter vibrioides (strain ATCC 19089 / CIP 103742 / CB 15) TaxID=190650 RepID=Q9A266_CAUVC|nr:hypothetical protein CC_3700 [Caulobacter vibrioides CB15]